MDLEGIDVMLDGSPYGLSQSAREEQLTPVFADLTEHHRAHCVDYAQMLAATRAAARPEKLIDVPWLPVQLFKSRRLVSVPDKSVFKVLTSSGTTGQHVSRIYLDRQTALRQTRALSAIMSSLLGPHRLPMLIVDTRSVLADRHSFSARGAGILGMMNHGRHHTYVLDEDMSLDRAALEGFLDRYGAGPFLVFGFTFMVWKYLYGALEDGAIDLSQGKLVHSGGWKRLADEAVSPEDYRSALRRRTGLAAVRNFYGMVEQVGSVFLEGADGLLHPPRFADVIVRNPITWREQPVGEAGVLQVMSALPTSYPGHSILTEDWGVVKSVDGSREGGKAFRVLGRVPKVEVRGCSDTHALASSGTTA